MSRSQPMTQQETHSGAPGTVRRTSRMAIWSLVLAILTLGGVGSIAGIMLGSSARRRIAVTGERGEGIALAGIVVGVITLLLAIGYWVFIGMHIGGGGTGGGGGGGGGY